MGIDGRFTGFAVGGLLGGPVGALFGGLIGDATDEAETEVSAEKRQKQSLIVHLAIYLHGIGSCDGYYSPKEKYNANRMLVHINNTIGAGMSGPEISKWVESAHRYPNLNVQDVIEQGRKDEGFRWLLIKLAWRLAACEEGVSDVERAWIERAAAQMNCDPRHLFLSSLSYVRGAGPINEKGKAAAALGVSTAATLEEAQSAYRTLVKKYHPDLYKNHPQEFQNVAKDKLIEFNDAFEIFKSTTAHGVEQLYGILVNENRLAVIKPLDVIRCMVCAKSFQLDGDPVPPTLRCTDCQTLLLHPLNYAQHLISVHHNHPAPIV